MKTAISMPDDTFDRVTQTARKLGMSRSELMTKATVAYLDDLESHDLTREIDRVLEVVQIDVNGDRAVVEASKGRLADQRRVVTQRGDIWWVDLGPDEGSWPAKRRPVLVIQSDAYNDSRMATVIVAVVTSNTDLAAMPGNVFLPAAATGLPRDSVVNVAHIYTLNKTDLTDRAGLLVGDLLKDVGAGLRQVLQL